MTGSEPSGVCLHHNRQKSTSSVCSGCETITIENSVIKGYHAFKIRPPHTEPKTRLRVDREYTNINDRDACLVWIPELSTFDETLHSMVTDHQRNLMLSDVAGLAIGHVPRILASCFRDLLDSRADIYATAMGDPVQSFPPWPAPSEKGGGAVIPCSYTITVKNVPETLELLKKTMSTMPEGSVMNIKVNP